MELQCSKCSKRLVLPGRRVKLLVNQQALRNNYIRGVFSITPKIKKIAFMFFKSAGGNNGMIKISNKN